MNKNIKNFSDAAISLSRNPLGIIALFIVLVYAIAGLVIMFGSNINEFHITLLIWFLIVFPVLVFLVFTWLVTHHHTKFYAPRDFRSDESYLSQLSPIEQKSRISEELNIDKINSFKRSREAVTVGKVLPTKNDVTKLIESTVLAEDLALRQIEYDWSVSIRRQVAIKTNGLKTEFDGIVYTSDGITAIEVKYISEISKILSKSMIDSIISKSIIVAKNLISKGRVKDFKLLLVIVTDLPENESSRMIEKIMKKLTDSEIKIKLLTYEFAKLKEAFVTTK